MFGTLKRGVELWEARGRQILLSPILQVTQYISFIHQVLNLLLLGQVVQVDHLESVLIHRCVDRQDALHITQTCRQRLPVVVGVMVHDF